MLRHLRANQEGDLAAEDVNGEDAAKTSILLTNHRDGSTHEPDQPTHERYRRDGRWEPFASGARLQEELDEGDGDDQQHDAGDELLLVVASIHRLVIHANWQGNGYCVGDVEWRTGVHIGASVTTQGPRKTCGDEV